MIDLSQSTLAYLLLCSFLLGIAHGVLYDAIRFAKLLLGVSYGKPQIKHSKARTCFLNVITFAFDVAFWMCFGVSSVLLSYNVSGGVFRGMVYLAMLIGGGLYYLTLGRLMLIVSQRLTSIIKKAVRLILGWVFKPIRAIISFIIHLYHLTIGKVIGKIVYRIRQRRIARQKKHNACAVIPQNTEENDRNVNEYRYKREGRIRFAGGACKE